MWHPSVEVISDDTGLTRQYWRFRLRNGKVFLAAWYKQSRPTTRHKWRIDEEWGDSGEIDMRWNNTPRPKLPREIRNDVLWKMRDLIKFEDHDNGAKG